MLCKIKAVRNLDNGTSWKIKKAVSKCGKTLYDLKNLKDGSITKVWGDSSLKEIHENGKRFMKNGVIKSRSLHFVSNLIGIPDRHTHRKKDNNIEEYGFISKKR